MIIGKDIIKENIVLRDTYRSEYVTQSNKVYDEYFPLHSKVLNKFRKEKYLTFYIFIGVLILVFILLASIKKNLWGYWYIYIPLIIISPIYFFIKAYKSYKKLKDIKSKWDEALNNIIPINQKALNYLKESSRLALEVMCLNNNIDYLQYLYDCKREEFNIIYNKLINELYYNLSRLNGFKLTDDDVILYYNKWIKANDY